MPLDQIQFRVLYRQFLFRVVDLELLSPQGDISRLLGQFAALLIFVSVGFSLGALGVDTNRMSHQALLVAAWGFEHVLIATTMLVVGLFAVLSWDSTFPDRRDALVLGPLPVTPRTIFTAKVAAVGAALGVTVAALNGATGIVLPLVLVPLDGGLLDLIFSLAFVRSFAAYWMTMLAAGAFIFCCVLGVQGLTAYVIPRRRFLRASAFLQMAAFCLFVSVYFLQPALATPRLLGAPDNQRLLAWLPSYWFLGLFQQLNGSMHPAIGSLALRAWIGLGIAGVVTCTAYLLSYFRALRKTIEEPDILPSSRRLRWLPRFGNSLETAVVRFTIRTALRSRQHRVMLAFYLGTGIAIVIFMLRVGVGRGLRHFVDDATTQLMFSSFIIMTAAIIGTRVVFSIPLELRANWIFRATEIRGATEYLPAIRRPLFVIAVVPVWWGSAAVFLSIWPWRAAVEHLAILGLWGLMVAYLSLHGFQKIPFTCSYLPGKSMFNMAFLAAIGLVILIGKGVDFESRALGHPASYTKMLILLSIAAFAARWRTVTKKPEQATVQFDELPAPAVLVLGLNA